MTFAMTLEISNLQTCVSKRDSGKSQMETKVGLINACDARESKQGGLATPPHQLPI